MIQLKEAGIISTSLQAILYGFSVLMFILTMWILLRNRRRRRLNYGLMGAACALLILATVEMVVNIVRVCQGFLSIGPQLPEGPEQYFGDVSQPTFVLKSCLYNAQTLILDGILIYRTYVVWQSVLIIIVPVLVWCGLLAASIGTNIALATAATHSGDIFAVQTGRWITSIYATTLATNLSSSSLLAFRIWQVNRRAGQYRSGTLRPVLRAVIESGAIYSVTITVALITFVLKSNSVYVVLDMISPIISIVFNMIIVRVGLAGDRRIVGGTTQQSISVEVEKDGSNFKRRPRDPGAYAMQALAVEVTQTRVCHADDSSHVSDSENQMLKSGDMTIPLPFDPPPN